MNEIGVQEAAREVDVVVIGAGQAGLSSTYHLQRTGYEPERDFVVLDHAPQAGGAWQFRWPSLTYGKVHGMHSLPGMELTDADPDRPSSEVIAEYFDAYERAFGLRVRRPVDVRAVREGDGGRLLLPDFGVERNGFASQQVRQRADSRFATGRTLVDVSQSGGNCLRVWSAAWVTALGTLRLRQNPIDPFDYRVGFHA